MLNLSRREENILNKENDIVLSSFLDHFNDFFSDGADLSDLQAPALPGIVLEGVVQHLDNEGWQDAPLDIFIGNDLISIFQDLPDYQPDGTQLVSAYLDYIHHTGKRWQDFEHQLGWMLCRLPDSEVEQLLVSHIDVSTDDQIVLTGIHEAWQDALSSPDLPLFGAPPPEPLMDSSMDDLKLFVESSESERIDSIMSEGIDDLASEVALSAPPPQTAEQIPRSFYARLSAPEQVYPETEFPLEVGLQKEASNDTLSTPMHLPESIQGSYTLCIQLVPDGFRFRESESEWIELRVTAGRPYPSALVYLTAVQDPDLKATRQVLATYWIEGQMIGSAARLIKVVSEQQPIKQDFSVATIGIDFAVPTAETAPDLTILITKANDTGGSRLNWRLGSPLNLALPKTIPPVDVGADPQEFSLQLMTQVNRKEGTPTLFTSLVGRGRTIADKMPLAVRKALQRLAVSVTERRPTVLIISQEPHIPWELAYMDYDDGKESFLAARFVVGRWVLGVQMDDDGSYRPPLPPPVMQEIHSAAVVSGDYSLTQGWSRLEQAEMEASQLTVTLDAEPVPAELTKVMNYLDAGPPSDLLHFAVHGKFDHTETRNGLAMIDGNMLGPYDIKSYRFRRQPFVFLNACQIGQGDSILGDYAGMAASFLYAGAVAVVAPLWSINDGAARKVATRFYDAVKSGQLPAEALRAERESFHAEDATSTFLAYQFFGHPNLRLELF